MILHAKHLRYLGSKSAYIASLSVCENVVVVHSNHSVPILLVLLLFKVVGSGNLSGLTVRKLKTVQWSL